ncbi:hypothetical protein RHGRI_015038 [Rhododendron griersonianum]|uniref:Uncharacterized protein n=1 Tax=Rhododendron griersonianum TaxID=479676 RepID=A0AAV6KBR3_9ERIC|nr:hypothetical protein RHGRI_015038 [Rhododendron griersonianum]
MFKRRTIPEKSGAAIPNSISNPTLSNLSLLDDWFMRCRSLIFVVARKRVGTRLRMGMESDVFVANPLNDIYAESGNSTEASIVIHILNTRNVVSWNAMIADFARSSLEHAAGGLVGQISSC